MNSPETAKVCTICERRVAMNQHAMHNYLPILCKSCPSHRYRPFPSQKCSCCCCCFLFVVLSFCFLTRRKLNLLSDGTAIYIFTNVNTPTQTLMLMIPHMIAHKCPCVFTDVNNPVHQHTLTLLYIHRRQKSYTHSNAPVHSQMSISHTLTQPPRSCMVFTDVSNPIQPHTSRFCVSTRVTGPIHSQE